jgi:septum formation protein
MGLDFECLPAPDDGPGAAGGAAERVLAHARHKARWVAARRPEAWVLAADTLVFLEDQALAKPRDWADALRMLRALSGRTHEVWTAAVLIDPQGSAWERADAAVVRFATLPEPDLQAYLATEEWRDKAGAYALQGWAGRHARLERGWPGTVIGLAREAVTALLAEARGQR